MPRAGGVKAAFKKERNAMRRLCKSIPTRMSSRQVVIAAGVLLCTTLVSAESIVAAEPSSKDLSKMMFASLEGSRVFQWSGNKSIQVDPQKPLSLGEYYISVSNNTVAVIFVATSVRKAEIDVEYIFPEERPANRANVSVKGPDAGDGKPDTLSTAVYQIPPGKPTLVKVTCRVRDSDLSGFVPKHQAVRIVCSDRIPKPETSR